MEIPEHEELSLLRQHVEQLGEHFDTVQIFATRHDVAVEDGTVNITHGSGNWFARYGQVSEWLVKTNERVKIFARDEERD